MFKVCTKSPRMPHIIAGTLLGVGFGILFYLGLAGSSVAVYSVSEFLKAKQTEAGNALHDVQFEDVEKPKFPKVDESIQIYGSIAKLIKQNNLNIILQDQETKTDSIRVNYIGIVPDNLKLGQAIFLTGKYDFGSEEFIAYEIVTTCPSKYQSKDQVKE